ncbi:Transcriptional regulator PadR family [Lactococcus cremoris]|uniref:Transcriptional regulator PadR family n=1 Tax=Lactococcus lactis subsp. cremoris TaxID=1359 RepID=A0A166KJ77_LACLC|nr:PadR family transcriptional regulator [Lactococcus cremoris]KZK08436.1 Transcriptional regulator PadR family [Lactococcus cremoris]
MQGKDVILGLLNGQERTGYEIKEVIETRLKYFFDGTVGMIYPTLKKLEKEGKVEKKFVIQDGKPNKNVYSITEEGKKDFLKYLTSSTDEEILKSDFLVRIYFGKNLEEGKLESIIHQEIERKKRNLKELQTNYEKWEKTGIDPLQTITYKYGIAYYEAVLKVLEDSLKEL